MQDSKWIHSQMHQFQTPFLSNYWCWSYPLYANTIFETVSSFYSDTAPSIIWTNCPNPSFLSPLHWNYSRICSLLNEILYFISSLLNYIILLYVILWYYIILYHIISYNYYYFITLKWFTQTHCEHNSNEFQTLCFVRHLLMPPAF